MNDFLTKVLPESKKECGEHLQFNKVATLKAATLLGDTWLLLIIGELVGGAKRFGEIQEALGKINPQTLSGRLKQLEHCGIVTRQAFAEIPPRVEYALTTKGLASMEILKALAKFGEEYLLDPQQTSRI